mmetsp:Transcript_1842/g.6061  ORF Transcript_1842/g.6061 Transcript_1842/m.6061 type:complete len:260 (+) Transcript_1842:52-831(+)
MHVQMSPPRLSLVLLLLPPCASAVRFLVLRHGQTDHNRDGIIQGSSDVSRLSDRGRTQAREVGAALARLGDVRVARTFLSPLARAQQTHEILLLDRPDLPTPTTLDGLREIDLSSWEGRAKAELRAEQPDVYAAWQCDPLAMVVDGRKPIVELWERARSAAWPTLRAADTAAAEDDEGATLVVCHGSLGQALLCTALGLDATAWRRHPFPNCGMAEIDWPADAPRATRWRWRLPEEGCWQSGTAARALHLSRAGVRIEG